MPHGDSGATLIVVEDHDDDFDLIRSALEQGGCKSPVLRAADGKELLDLLYERDSEPGSGASRVVVLLDLNMAGMDGREVLRALKNEPRLRLVPAVVFTASLAPKDIREAYELGARGYIPKPARFSEFVVALDSFRRYWLDCVELPPLRGRPL